MVKHYFIMVKHYCLHSVTPLHNIQYINCLTLQFSTVSILHSLDGESYCWPGAPRVLGRELAAHPFELPQLAGADGRRLARNGVFERRLRNYLVGLVLLLDAGIEHLARGNLDDVGDVAAVVAVCQFGKMPEVDVVCRRQLRQFQAEEAFACLLVGHVHVDELVDTSCPEHGLSIISGWFVAART